MPGWSTNVVKREHCDVTGGTLRTLPLFVYVNQKRFGGDIDLIKAVMFVYYYVKVSLK